MTKGRGLCDGKNRVISEWENLEHVVRSEGGQGP